MKHKILVSGSLVYDKIMDFQGKFSDHIMPEKIHSLSVCFVVDKMKVNFGGTAGNIAYNLKLLGEEPVILSQAGADFSNYGKWLRKNRLILSGIKLLKDKNTATAHIVTDRADNQITALHLETMGVPCGITEKKVRNFGEVAMAIVAPGNTQDMLDAVRVYKKLGMPYIADPGQQIPLLSARELDFLIKNARVLIGNDYELALIMKALRLGSPRLSYGEAGKNMEVIQRLVKVLVVTYGAQGSVICSNHRQIKIKAVSPRKIVDPTGAGDAYRAGFIKGIVSGWDLKKCGELASWLAKFPVEHYGTQEHRFKFSDFKS